MVFGYVLIGTKNSYEHEVADKLSRLDEVVDVEPLVVEETALADPFFEEYELAATHDCDWCMPWRDEAPIWLARRPKGPISVAWPELKHYE